MKTIEKIRHGLIDKILAIDDQNFLEALDTLVASTKSNPKVSDLTADQKEMLQMSEQDIQNGSMISQEAMNERNLKWLDER